MLARVAIAKAAAKAALGEMTGDLARLARAVSALANALDSLGRDQSPLDWARGQTTLARALAQLGEATENETAFQKALACYDRAGLVLKRGAGPRAARRGRQRPRRWRWRASPSSPATPRCSTPPRPPSSTSWPPARTATTRSPGRCCRCSWGRSTTTRLALTRRDRGERAAAALAFQAALDVFGEEGLRSLAAIAAEGLERLASAKVG